MGHKLAIDFGTTNSVVAHWDDDQRAAQIVAVPGIGTEAAHERPSIVPSLVYVQDGQAGEVIAGQNVIDAGLDCRRDNRLFRNFKRGIVAAPAPEPRHIDSKDWSDRDAGRSFITRLIRALPYRRTDIEELVLTAPVAAFEGYLGWLNDAINGFAPEQVRIVDESTAAALGYAVNEPGTAVLVFDFGGGTLDLSLVQLPESKEKTGGFLGRLRGGGSRQHAAQVIAKAGRIIGGSDVDQWLLAEALRRADLTTGDLGSSYPALLTACEQAKIALSTAESADVAFEADGQSYQTTITRPELEALLDTNGFYTALRHVVEKVLHVARRRGIFKEDIGGVLLVGGTSLMPSVQAALRQYFGDVPVHAHKPFTAVAEGALQVAAGFGLEDYLAHSYGLRHLDPETGRHEYDEIIPMGSRYPTEAPVEIVLGAAHPGQQEIEFVIGEIDTEAVSMVEVKYEDGQAVFVAQMDKNAQQIITLNEEMAANTTARLNPPGAPGEDRVRALFGVDARRQLRLTVLDLKTGKTLLDDVVVATVR